MYAELEIGRYGKVKKIRTAPLINSLPYYKAWLTFKLFFSFLLLLYSSLLLADNILVTPAILYYDRFCTRQLASGLAGRFKKNRIIV